MGFTIRGSNPGEGEIFSTKTGPRDNPASCTMGTGSAFPGGEKRPGRGIDHPSPCCAEVKERVELYLYSQSGPSWYLPGRNPLYLKNSIIFMGSTNKE